jgi:hypothetical protein
MMSTQQNTNVMMSQLESLLAAPIPVRECKFDTKVLRDCGLNLAGTGGGGTARSSGWNMNEFVQTSHFHVRCLRPTKVEIFQLLGRASSKRSKHDKMLTAGMNGGLAGDADGISATPIITERVNLVDPICATCDKVINERFLLKVRVENFRADLTRTPAKPLERNNIK